MRIAAIDVGSNSTRLLVADFIEKTNKVLPVTTALATTRLGQGISAGRLADDAMKRTIDVIKGYMQQADRLNAQKTIIAATSAVRDAENKTDFADAVYAAAGVRLNILPGHLEARLSYLGVAGSFEGLHNALVVDIGGGSTEFIWHRAGEVQFASINVGAVRMTESGYGRGEIECALRSILANINHAAPDCVIGVGGTVTTLAAMVQGLRQYDPNRVHGFILDVQQIDELYFKLRQLSLLQRKELPGLQPERADIIPAGARILSRILHGINRDRVLVSETGILYGMVREWSKL